MRLTLYCNEAGPIVSGCYYDRRRAEGLMRARELVHVLCCCSRSLCLDETPPFSMMLICGLVTWAEEE